MSSINIKNNTKTLIIALACANTALYGLPYLKGQFYDIEISALSLTNAQMGRLFSIYGVVSVAAYLIGGIIADRLPGKKILLAALITSGGLHLYVITQPSYMCMCFIFAAMAVTSILMFYPTSMKTLTYLGKDHKGGSVFGDYMAIVSIFSIIIAVLGWVSFKITASSKIVFNILLLIYGLLHFVAAYLIAKFYSEDQGDCTGNKFQLRGTKTVLSDKNVWRVIILVFTNYMMGCALTYVIPYLSDIYEMGTSDVLIISIVRVNIIAAIVSPMAGRIVDHIGLSVRLVRDAFIVAAAMISVILLSCCINVPLVVSISMIMLATAAITAAKNFNFLMLTEIDIPQKYMGTAIGFVSLFGYSPDAFFYTIAGSAVDMFNIQGYLIVFGIFCCCGLIGFIIGTRLLNFLRNKNKLF